MTADEMTKVLNRVSGMLDTEGVPNTEAMTLCDMVLGEIEKETTGKVGGAALVASGIAAAIGIVTGLGLLLPGAVGAYMGYKFSEDCSKQEFGPIILRATMLKAKADGIK
jgi:hypothetical protein